MSILRVKESVAVLDPESETFVTLLADARYDSSHPLVREYPWAFQRDAEVEQTSAAPGEKRNR